jgi:hypothetical protein
MREWLQQNGHTVSSRGPISAANKQLFYSANTQYSPDSKEPAREVVRKQVAMADMEARGADKREMRKNESAMDVLKARGYSDKQIRTWMYQQGKGYVLVRELDASDLREMIDADREGRVNPLTLKEITDSDYEQLLFAKNLYGLMLSKLPEIQAMEKVTRRYPFTGSTNYYIDQFMQTLETLRQIDNGNTAPLGSVQQAQKVWNGYAQMKQDYNDITVPRIVQEAAADLSKAEVTRLVKDNIPIEIIRQNVNKPLNRLKKKDWAELYRKIVVGQIKSAWVDETQAMEQEFAPDEAAALPGPSAPKVAPRTVGQGSSELSYETTAQTIPSVGGSSAAPPEPDTHVDNRLRIELFWPDPLTPSEERRWIFVDLSQNYA